jgi:hypothetical protein
VACGTRLSFSPNTAIEAVRLSQASVDDRLLGLLGLYHQHAISTFYTCSRMPNHRSLTNTGGGYNLGGVSLPHHTPQPSQPTILHFSPKGPALSQVNNPTLPTKQKGILTLISRVGLLHSTSTIVYPLSRATTSGKPPQDRINKGNQECWS